MQEELGNTVLLISIKPRTSNNIELAIGLKYLLVIGISGSGYFIRSNNTRSIISYLDGADFVYDGWFFLYNKLNDIKMKRLCFEPKPLFSKENARISKNVDDNSKLHQSRPFIREP